MFSTMNYKSYYSKCLSIIVKEPNSLIDMLERIQVLSLSIIEKFCFHSPGVTGNMHPIFLKNNKFKKFQLFTFFNSK